MTHEYKIIKYTKNSHTEKEYSYNETFVRYNLTDVVNKLWLSNSSGTVWRSRLIYNCNIIVYHTHPSYPHVESIAKTINLSKISDPNVLSQTLIDESKKMIFKEQLQHKNDSIFATDFINEIT